MTSICGGSEASVSASANPVINRQRSDGLIKAAWPMVSAPFIPGNSPRSGRPLISTIIDRDRSPFGNRADHARDFGGRLDHILDQVVDGAQLGIPAAGRSADSPALSDLAFLADDLGEPLQLLGQLLFHADNLVEQHRDLAVLADVILTEANRKVAAAQAAESRNEAAAVEKGFGRLAMLVHAKLLGAVRAALN